MSPKKAYIFDLGNVLVHVDFEKMKENAAEVFRTTPEHFDMRAVKALIRLYDTGKITTEDFLGEIATLADHKPSLEAFEASWNGVFSANTPMWAFVEELKKQGHRLILLSNTNESHYTFIAKEYPILEAFDVHILSYEVGHAKPDRAIYDIAIEAAEMPASACIFTDDLPENIEAARDAGMEGIVYSAGEHEEYLARFGER